MTTDESLSISVVLPVFMRCADSASIQYLLYALESVFDQEYPNRFEIIIVDDGSPLPVKNIIQTHIPGNMTPEMNVIRWFRSERNEGLVSALNTGLREARYDLIARIDADDRWVHGKIAKQVCLFRTDPDLSLVATNTVFIDAEGKAYDRLARSDGWGNSLHWALEKGCPFPHASVVARRSVYRLLGGYSHDPVYAYLEDYHLWSKWIRFFKPATIEQFLFEYRTREDSICHIHHESQVFAIQQIMKYLVSTTIDWRNHPGNMQNLADLLGVNLIQCGAICYRIWRYNPSVAMPREAVNVLQEIMPDRRCSIDSNDRDLRQVYQFVDLAEGFPNADGSTATRTNGAEADDVLVHVR